MDSWTHQMFEIKRKWVRGLLLLNEMAYQILVAIEYSFKDLF